LGREPLMVYAASRGPSTMPVPARSAQTLGLTPVVLSPQSYGTTAVLAAFGVTANISGQEPLPSQPH